MPITNFDQVRAVRRKPASKTVQDQQARIDTVKHIHSLKMPNGLLHKLIAALPIVATNAVAVLFQFRFAQSALGHNLAVSVLFSATLESVAISIAYHGHLARMANLRSGTLRLASVVVAASIAVLNASHEYHANLALAATAFGCSFISPFLWEMYSRQVSSVILVKSGHLDMASIRLGQDRWLFHPLRSFQVKSHSAWNSERNIHKAIQAYERRTADKAIRKVTEKSARNLDTELLEL